MGLGSSISYLTSWIKHKTQQYVFFYRVLQFYNVKSLRAKIEDLCGQMAVCVRDMYLRKDFKI